MSQNNIVVTPANRPWIEDLPVEVVERKGIGHPDTLCDGMAERIARAYAEWCLEHVGRPLHHNFDKVQLVAGQAAVSFGGGEMLKPIRVQIAGRATDTTPDGRAVPVAILAIEAAKAHLRETVRHLDPERHCVVDSYVGSGASELVHVVERVTANDTSFGVAHWPFSQLERTVYETTQFINAQLRYRLPIGEDVKVMGTRRRNEITLTCAIPLLSREVPSLEAYREVKTAVREAVQTFAVARTPRSVRVAINTADDASSGDVYLTLTGTSAECGDDGAVGRGNRVTGLITPFRAASLEASAGKNALSHAGKLYNVLALRMAQAVVAEVPDVREAEIVLLSQIGRALSEPLVANVAVQPRRELTDTMRDAVAAVVQAQLDDIDGARRHILAGDARLF